MKLITQRRNLSWLPWASRQMPPLLSKEDEIKVLQYRGKIDDFNNYARQFELYLRDQPGDGVPDGHALVPGKCTPEGTQRFKKRAIDKGIPQKNFRKPIIPSMADNFELSTVGLGSYLGKPDDEDDFDLYVAARSLLQSSTVNVFDSAINYRCQKSERTFGAVFRNLMSPEFSGEDSIKRDEIWVSSKTGYVPEDADKGIPSATLLEKLIEEEQITKEDVAGGIHCMHPKYLQHQLQASQENLGLQTIDLMYLHNSFEQQAHYISQDVYFDRLAKAFEFYESKRLEGDIQFYGMATWLCFRAKPEEENIYLNLQKCMEVAAKIGGQDHGFRFIQVPLSVSMPEAIIEKWQEFDDASKSAAGTEPEAKILVAVCNLLKMNLIASKPLLGGQCKEIDIPSLKDISDPVARHLQLVRSMPPRCLISTMCGMKSLQNVKTNYNQVLVKEPLTRAEFLKAMNLQ